MSTHVHDWELLYIKSKGRNIWCCRYCTAWEPYSLDLNGTEINSPVEFESTGAAVPEWCYDEEEVPLWGVKPAKVRLCGVCNSFHPNQECVEPSEEYL